MHNSLAESVTILQAKNKLKQLDEQIHQLKQTVSHTQDKRGILNHELANTEKQIGACFQKIKAIEHDITLKQQNIVTLQQRVATLSRDMTQQQELLAQHVRARYKIGEYRPVIIAMNQNDLFKINRLLTFYQYLVRSRQDLIANIIQTQKSLVLSQENLQQEIKEQQNLQGQLHRQQENFEQTKNYHQVVIKSLSQEIQSQQHTLSEYQQDKANLSRLVQTLARESQRVVQPAQPFMTARHKLSFPVNVARNAIQHTNQGLTFLGKEGASVTAVYPGRVVFSDWLKGYGLLLILDHGQGFMTLYAHNQALFKQKGAQVRQGEQIATIGHSGGLKQNGLYFEVRQRGKAVPPLEWLR
jgi:murein hydrolase activator